MTMYVVNLNEFTDQLGSTKFEDNSIRRAMAHDRKMVQHLGSKNGWTRGHGQGKLLEYYIYEMIKQNIGGFRYIEKLVLKGRDVPERMRNSDKGDLSWLFQSLVRGLGSLT